jgi:hypothetical protein
MVAPVVPNQFEVGKNKIVHKPTKAAFSFDTGRTTFKSVNWGRAGEQLSSGPEKRRRNAGCAAAAEQATQVDGHGRQGTQRRKPGPTLLRWPYGAPRRTDEKCH